MIVERGTSVRRKYASLGFGELTAAVVFGFVGAHVARGAPDGSLGLWSALMPLLVILVQAGAYWLLARDWVGRRPMPASLATAYRLFRFIDPLLLTTGLIGVAVWPPADLTVPALAAWFFGVVEYVNYYVARLSYPIHRWPLLVGQWRTPRLVRDLRAQAATSVKAARE